MKFQFLNWQTNLLNNIQTYSKTFLNGYLIFICGIYTPGIYKEFNTALTCLVLRFTQKKNDIKKGMWRTPIFPIKKLWCIYTESVYHCTF